jgi:hypothetical protein
MSVAPSESTFDGTPLLVEFAARALNSVSSPLRSELGKSLQCIVLFSNVSGGSQ